MSLPVRTFLPPRPEDTDTALMSARLRDRLRLRRTDGSSGPLFGVLALHDRSDAPREYPGQLEARAVADAEDMNEIQYRALEAIGQLDRDVDMLIGRLRVEIGAEVNRFRRVHNAFQYETSVEAPPGGQDPNPNDLFDQLRAQTRLYFNGSVSALVNDLYGFWLGPPAYGAPADGEPPRKPALERFEADYKDSIDVAFVAAYARWKTYDDLKYALVLRFLRYLYPTTAWPSIEHFNPDAPEARRETDAYHIWRILVPGELPPTPQVNDAAFLAWLQTPAALAALIQPFPLDY